MHKREQNLEKNTHLHVTCTSSNISREKAKKIPDRHKKEICMESVNLDE